MAHEGIGGGRVLPRAIEFENRGGGRQQLVESPFTNLFGKIVAVLLAMEWQRTFELVAEMQRFFRENPVGAFRQWRNGAQDRGRIPLVDAPRFRGCLCGETLD